jgi:hypothetical protein
MVSCKAHQLKLMGRSLQVRNQGNYKGVGLLVTATVSSFGGGGARALLNDMFWEMLWTKGPRGGAKGT